MKSSSIFGRVLFLGVLILSPYFAFSAPVIQGPVVPAMYWRSLTGVSIFYTGGFVGIGMNNPLYRLDVAGTGSFDGLHMVTGASSGFVLTSDASGNARWISTGSLIPAESDPQVGTVTTNYVPKWTGTSLNNGTIFDTSTGVGIGTIAPSARLAVNGSIVYTESLSRTQANTVQYNNVVQWAISTPNQTGALKISLPRTWSNTMLSIKITGYEYSSTAGVWSTTVGGYNYAAGPSWINSSAYVLGKTPFSQIRLAHDGVTNTILLGNTGTIWNYSKIVVEEVFAGHSNMTGWGTGWTISLITDETGISSVLNLVAPTYVSAAGNFGVGTMLPAYRLDVVGTGNVTGFRMPTGASSGFLLTSDPTGNARWLAAPNSGWGLNGNAGTSSGTNFVGTTDVQDLVFKVNSTEYLRIRAGGSLVGVGYSSTMSGSNQIALGLDAGFAMSGSFNSAIGGLEAGYFMRGIRNIAFGGYRAGNLMSGSYNSAFGGIQAGYQMGGAYSTAIGGYQAGNAMAGSHNTVIGGATVGYSMSGTYNAAIGGGSAGTFMQGSQNTAIGGVSAGANMSGTYNVAMGGYYPGQYMSGTQNLALGGYYAGNAMTGSYNTAIGGYLVGYNMRGVQNTAVGSNASITNATVQNGVVIGSGAYSNQSGAIVIGGSGANVGIGAPNPLAKLSVAKEVTMNTNNTLSDGQIVAQGATVPGKQLLLGYDTTGNGFGFIKAGNDNVAWTNLALQPIAGNVGIGTTNPAFKFDIYGSGNAPIGQRIQNEGTGASAYSVFQFATRAPSSWANMLLNDSSGIPYYQLMTGTGVRNAFFNMPNYYFQSNTGTAWMTITNTGYVGIGTTNPGAKLEVTGNVIASTPTASNHLATKAYVDAAISSGAVMRVYRNDGTTLLGTLAGVDANDIVYTLGDGTIVTAFNNHRQSASSINNSYFFTTNCTGAGYVFANWDWNSGTRMSWDWYYNVNGDVYFHYTYNNSPYTPGLQSTWNGTSCVTGSYGGYLGAATTSIVKICGVGDCKIKP